ncbi:TonB-dependent receptor [Acinetobacter courvalinii]|uniref:TonB-dependent receptor n=1 Tax=Acinetobacter courvalinii TaxID=280147 RepID=UPI001900F143|nr:TonB-dependent receptor [Acinetobacter courvalinii]MBJ9957609.1 TonB-dependent receptor [Acinetobacter courvalinii]
MKKNLLFLSLIALPMFAVAEDNTVLPIIVVKADSQATDATGKLKKDASLGILGEKAVLDTPFSIQSYTEQAIKDKQADSIAGILKNDPSIRTTTNSGHLNENFMIRGFAVTWEDANINGAYGMSPSGRTPTDILSSASVLKGPNALIAGMAPGGSIGGVVMATTKRADRDLTQVSAMYEDGGYYKSGIDVSRRFGEDNKFGARVSATYGQGEHIADGLEDENTAAVLALDYTTDQAKINFDAYSVRDKRDGGSPAMISFTTLGRVLPAPDGKLNYFPHLEGMQSANYVGLSGEYKLLPNLKVFAGAGFNEREYRGHLFGTRMIVGDYPMNHQGMGNTSPLVGANGDALAQYYRVGSKEHNTTFNAGLEGQIFTGDISHTLAFRTDYLKRKYSQHKGRGAKEVYFPTNIYNPSSEGHMPDTWPEIVPTADDVYVSYSLSDQISMLDDKLQFILGVRYQDMNLKALTTNTKLKDDKLSPSAAIVIKPFGEETSFYASYVEGLVRGATVSNEADANYNKTFAPFESKQYEIGAKYQGDRWLHTLALYQIKKPSTMTDTSYRDPNNANIKQITMDGAKTESKGVEYGFSGKVTEDLIVYGNLAYIDTEYKKGLLTGGVDISGNTIEGTPEITAGVGVDYTLPYVEGLSVNAFVTYVDDQYLTANNNLKLPDYTLVDLGAKYTTKLGGVNTTFRANVDNVADKKYWDGVFTSGFTTVGAGRTYKLGVSFDF